MSGTVVRWDEERGFGFIAAAGYKRDIFVHRTGIVDDGRHQKRKVLFENDEVEFDTTPGKEGKGPQAINVRVK